MADEMIEDVVGRHLWMPDLNGVLHCGLCLKSEEDAEELCPETSK